MDGRFFSPSTGLNDSLASLLWESCCVSFASHVLVIYSEQFEAISASLSPKGSKGGLVRGFLQNGLNSGLVGIIYSNLPSKLRGPSKSNNHRLLRNDALYQWLQMTAEVERPLILLDDIYQTMNMVILKGKWLENACPGGSFKQSFLHLLPLPVHSEHHECGFLWGSPIDVEGINHDGHPNLGTMSFEISIICEYLCLLVHTCTWFIYVMTCQPCILTANPSANDDLAAAPYPVTCLARGRTENWSKISHTRRPM